MSTTQLTSASGYNVQKMIFNEPQDNKIPNSSFSYKRINISTENNNGTTGDLVLKTPVLFSFGVQENINPESKEVNGYIMPLCLWNRNGPTDEEKEWTDTFNAICNRCKDHLIEKKQEINKWDLELADLKKFNPMYWKRDKKTGAIEPGTGPTLYPKLIVTKKDGNEKIMTVFYDKHTGEDISPLSILGKMCNVVAAIKIESIFIGNRISLQIKLWEVEVSVQQMGVKRLLRIDPETSGKREQILTSEVDEEDVSNEEGSIEELLDEEFIKPVSKKQVARK